jgi:hypothetical protein
MSTDTTGTGTAGHDDTTGNDVENPEVPAAPSHEHVPHDPEAVVDELDVDPEEIVHELDSADVLLDDDDVEEEDPLAALEDASAGDDSEA